MSRKVAEAVRQHLHDDFEVTELRLDAFAEAGRETQLQVMAELRLRSGDDWSTTELAFTAIALSAFGAIVVPTLELDPGAHTIVSVLIGLIVGVSAVVVLLPVLVPAILNHNRKSSARVWVGAYSDELARRQVARGFNARRWRRSH